MRAYGKFRMAYFVFAMSACSGVLNTQLIQTLRLVTLTYSEKQVSEAERTPYFYII